MNLGFSVCAIKIGREEDLSDSGGLSGSGFLEKVDLGFGMYIYVHARGVQVSEKIDSRFHRLNNRGGWVFELVDLGVGRLGGSRLLKKSIWVWAHSGGPGFWKKSIWFLADSRGVSI